MFVYITDDLNAVTSLIKKGADINSKDSSGWSALHLFSLTGNWKLKIRKEMHKSTNTNKLNWNSGNLTIVKYLIENGADVNTKTNEGSTPLHISSNKGNYGY